MKKKKKERALVLEMVHVSLKILGMNSSEQFGTFSGCGRTQRTSKSEFF